jgi:hypothetical protein
MTMKFFSTKNFFFIIIIFYQTQFLPQQYLTDDAAIVGYNSLQLESWYGINESWILPSIQLVSPFEITIGPGFIRSDDKVSRTFLQVQAKALYKEVSTNSFGIGIASGANISLSEKNTSNIFVYIPFSISFLNDLLLVHQNIGWAANTVPLTHNFTSGTRIDVTPINRITFYGELASTNFATPEFQLALRFEVLQDNLAVTISYYDKLKKEFDDKGVIAGFQWTPPQWF